MKNTGIVRKLDDLGRITLPIELRRTLDVAERDPLEIFVDENSIILKKYEGSNPKCAICGETENLINVDGINICRNHAIAIFEKVSSL